MIFGNIQNLKEFSFLEEMVWECLAYVKEHDLLSCGWTSHSCSRV